MLQNPASNEQHNERHDVGEFEMYLQPILSSAYKLALSLAQQREDAEDLVQNAAVRAFSAFDRFERGTNFKAWFFRILVNLFLHQRRDAGRRPQTTLLDDVPEWSLYAQMRRAGLMRRNDDPATLLLDGFDSQQIHAAFAAIPPDYRVVSLLYFVEGFSYQEIAGIVDCPLGTVRSRLHRGRKLLQRELWELASQRGLVSPSHKNLS